LTKIRPSIDLTLKSGWRFDTKKGTFVSASRTFTPHLARGVRIVYKVPKLAAADSSKLSKAERDLQRYMQVILPLKARPEDYLKDIQAWPSVAEAHVTPRVSLP
jgi:hypothetical protein